MSETPSQLEGTEREWMNIAEEAQSNIREQLFRKLTPEQQGILKGAELTLEEKGRGYPDWITIQGSVLIDGSRHELEVRRYEGSESTQPKYVLVVDRNPVDDLAKAEEMFDFYYPIAELVNEVNHYPTERSQKLVQSKLIHRMMGGM